MQWKVMTQVVMGLTYWCNACTPPRACRGIAVKLKASRNFRRVFRDEGLMPSGLNALEQMGLSSVERIPIDLCMPRSS